MTVGCSKTSLNENGMQGSWDDISHMIRVFWRLAWGKSRAGSYLTLWVVPFLCWYNHQTDDWGYVGLFLVSCSCISCRPMWMFKSFRLLFCLLRYMDCYLLPVAGYSMGWEYYIVVVRHRAPSLKAKRSLHRNISMNFKFKECHVGIPCYPLVYQPTRLFSHTSFTQSIHHWFFWSDCHIFQILAMIKYCVIWVSTFIRCETIT